MLFIAKLCENNYNTENNNIALNNVTIKLNFYI